LSGFASCHVHNQHFKSLLSSCFLRFNVRQMCYSVCGDCWPPLSYHSVRQPKITIRHPFIFTRTVWCNLGIPTHSHPLDVVTYVSDNDIIFIQSVQVIHFISCQNMYTVNVSPKLIVYFRQISMPNIPMPILLLVFYI
jgi:hypothetical protein